VIGRLIDGGYVIVVSFVLTYVMLTSLNQRILQLVVMATLMTSSIMTSSPLTYIDQQQRQCDVTVW